MITAIVVSALLFYIIAYVTFVGRDIVLATLSLTVGLLFVCQSKLYGLYTAELSQARWVALAATAAVAIGAIIVSRKSVAFNLAAVAPFAAGAFFFLTRSWSVSESVTVQRTISVWLLSAAVVGVIGYVANSVDMQLRLIKAIILTSGALFWCLTAVFGFDTSNIDAGTMRTAGPMSNPNGLAIVAAFSAPVAFLCWRQSRRRVERWLFFAVFVNCVFMLVITASRSALIAAIFAASLMVLASKGARILVQGMPVLLLALAAMLTYDMSTLPEVLLRYVRYDTLDTGSGRLEHWAAAMDLLRARPLAGYGFGTEDIIYDLQMIRVQTGLMVHNSYLGLAVQVGVIGAACFFAPLFWLLAKGVSRGTRIRDPLTIALSASLAVGLVVSFSESWLYSAGNSQSLPFWCLIGLLVVRLRSRLAAPVAMRQPSYSAAPMYTR